MLSRIFFDASGDACSCSISKARRTCASLNNIEALVTIVVGGLDVDIAVLVKMKRFIEEQCIVGLRSMERGGVLTHKHLQMMVKDNFVSLLVLNKKIKVCLGWDESLLMSQEI